MKRQLNIFGFCVNLKVVVALGAAGLALFIVAPRIAVAALPLLIVAICPLSMLLMMRGMRGAGPSASATSGGREDRLAELEEELAQLKRSRTEAAPARPGSQTASRAGRLVAVTSGDLDADRPKAS